METPSPFSRFFEAMARAIAGRPVGVLAIIAVITGVLGYHASQVRVNNSNEIFFVEDDPLLLAHRKFEKRFGSDQFVMVYVEGDLYSQDAFAAVDRLVDAMSAITWDDEPAFSGILSPYHAPTMRSAAGSIEVTPLLANLDNPSSAELEKAKKDATEHPVYRDLLVSRDGSAGAVVGTMHARPGDEAYGQYIAVEMRKLVQDEGLKRLGVLLVGDPIFKMQVDQATVNESATFGAGAILVSVLALFFIFGRKRQVSAAIGVVVLAVLWTVGLMSFFGVEMSLVSIILPLVIVIMGLGSGVHIINEFREQRRTGLGRKDSVVQALGATGLPCMLTATTTAIGFLSMVSAPVAPMRSLGLFASIGVLISFLLAVTLVPAILSIGDDVPDPNQGGDDGREHPLVSMFFVRLADVIVENRIVVTCIFLGISVALGSGLGEIRVESHVLQAFREDQEFRQAVEHVDRKLGGSTGVEVIIDSGSAGGVYDPEFLSRLAELQTWIEDTQSDVVGGTLSLVDLLKEINFAFTGERKLPSEKARAAQLMFLYEAGSGDARIVIDHPARRARLSLRTRQTTTSRSLELEKSLRGKAGALFDTWQPVMGTSAQASAESKSGASGDASEEEEIIIVEDEPAAAEDADILVIGEDEDTIDVLAADTEAAAPTKTTPSAKTQVAEDPPLAPGASRVEIAGTSQLFVHLADYVIDSQITSFGLAAVIISILMILMLRSLTLGLAVMIPNLLPIFCIYGFMGWTGISVDWLTALIAVAALGVAVDGTIHIGTRYRLARLSGLNAAGAARSVMTSIGRALVVTSVVLSIGFCVVAPSILASLSRFGLLMALCLFLALLFDLLMTPAVLAWLSPGAKK